MHFSSLYSIKSDLFNSLVHENFFLQNWDKRNGHSQQLATKLSTRKMKGEDEQKMCDCENQWQVS